MNAYDREVLRVVKDSFKLKPEIWTYDASGDKLVNKTLGLYIIVNDDESYSGYIKIAALGYNLSYSLFTYGLPFGYLIPWRRRVIRHFREKKNISPELRLFVDNITINWDKIRLGVDYETKVKSTIRKY